MDKWRYKTYNDLLYYRPKAANWDYAIVGMVPYLVVYEWWRTNGYKLVVDWVYEKVSIEELYSTNDRLSLRADGEILTRNDIISTIIICTVCVAVVMGLLYWRTS